MSHAGHPKEFQGTGLEAAVLKWLTPDGKLPELLWLLLTFSASLLVLAGRGGLLADQQVQNGGPFQT